MLGLVYYMGKVKSLSFKANTLSNLYVFITQILEGLLMDQYILKNNFKPKSFIRSKDKVITK